MNSRASKGISARPDTINHMSATGQMPGKMMNPAGEIQIRRIFDMPSSLGQTKNELQTAYEEMNWKERQNFLKSYDLKNTSIYNPLPEDPLVYQINVL